MTGIRTLADNKLGFQGGMSVVILTWWRILGFGG